MIACIMQRRTALQLFAAHVAASPLWAADDDVLGPVNVHEFEEVAKRKLHKLAYDFIAGGVEDERTLRANIEAYGHWDLVPRVMVDVTQVDTSLELFGQKLEHPILIAPTGGKDLVLPGAEEVVAQAALRAKTLLCSATGAKKLLDEGQPLLWWANGIGQPTKEQAQNFARRTEDGGGRAIVLTVDNAYQSNRDRNNRNRFDYGMMSRGVPKPGEVIKPVNPAQAAMWQPHTPNLTWDYIDWVKGATKIPIILKGIVAPEDAELAVKRGADGIVVSNHGGRQLDGVIGTLDALPEVVEAVGGKVPVLMDGGVRRGSDILKALSLGAKAVLVGRPPLWGLASFGQAGVERVLWMMAAELKLAMALAGQPKLATITRRLVRKHA
jgi:isopentenyl diphosphate isomerase/L-lactate dehydrogenase-like FMN-dependent dehydrogenase